MRYRKICQHFCQCRDGILERHFYKRFLGINSSLVRLEFLSGFLPSFFHSTKCTLFMSRLEFSCFANFFYGFVKPEKSMVLFKIRQWKGLWIAWNKRLYSFVKLTSKNSNSGIIFTIRTSEVQKLTEGQQSKIKEDDAVLLENVMKLAIIFCILMSQEWRIIFSLFEVV